MEDQPLGTVPLASKYWIEGALICLVPRLEHLNAALDAMTEAIEYGRDVCGRSSFDAVLILIFDVVLLKYLPDGTINYSFPLPLVRARDCIGLNARQRYSSTWLADALKRHQDNPCDPDEPMIDVANDPEIQCLLNLVPDDVVETSFLRPVNFFDSTAIASSIAEGSSACSLPPEVLSMILGFVCDTQTFIACTKVSRVFRELC